MVMLPLPKVTTKCFTLFPDLHEFPMFARMQAHSLHAMCKPIAKVVVAKIATTKPLQICWQI